MINFRKQKEKVAKDRILQLMEKYESEDTFMIHSIYETEKRINEPEIAII